MISLPMKEETDQKSIKSSRSSRTPLSDKVYVTLKTRITHGDYGTNGKLPPENDLAAQLGVSRPVLRVALEQLREEGIVISRQGAGNFVNIKLGSPPGYTRVETIADIQRCYEFRLTLEVEAAGLAAQRRNQAALDEILGTLDLLTDATKSLLHREDTDFAFHLAIARASNNQYFPETLKALRSHIYVGMKMHGSALMFNGIEALEQVLEEHREIYQAILNQDVATARKVMHGHIAHSQERLFGAGMLDLSM